MARKHVDLKAAKAAKQKKIAIGGGVLLVGLLAFSVPKTLAMLHHSPATSSKSHHVSHLTPSSSSSMPATGVATTPPVPVLSGTPTGSTVLTAQLAPPAREGQLESLSKSFKSKDPFEQLIPDDTVAPDTSQTTPTPDATAKPADAKPAPELKVVPAATPPASVTPTTPAAPKVVLPYVSAVISVNGVRAGVDLKVDFPVDSPLFRLVSVKKGTAKVTVVGGSLADGAPTLTLRRGKPVTLVNTADGTRYRLVLVSTSSSAAAATALPGTSTAPGQTAPATQTASPTTTTTTGTTTSPTLGG